MHRARELVVRARAGRHSDAWIFGTMAVSASLSLLAAFVLAVDAWQLAANPEAELSCNLSAAVSCGKVALSWQAKVLGFPNAFIGLAAEPVVVTVAVAGLSGVRFPRWFMLAAQCVYLVGLVFAYWLFSQSLLEIGALCPWCLLITISTTFVFATLLHVNALQENLFLPARASARLKEFFLQDLDVFVVATAIVLIAAAIVLRYGPALLA